MLGKTKESKEDDLMLEEAQRLHRDTKQMLEKVRNMMGKAEPENQATPVAPNPNTLAKTLKALSEDKGYQLRTENPSVQEEPLKVLANDKGYWVRGKNPEPLKVLANDKGYCVRGKNPSVPKETVETPTKDKD